MNDPKEPKARAYVHQEFPKWKYHKEHKARVVKSEAEEEELGEGWLDLPHGSEPHETVEYADHDADAAEVEVVRKRGRPFKAKA